MSYYRLWNLNLFLQINSTSSSTNNIVQARKNNVKFFIIDSFGFFGYMFEDLGEIFKYEKSVTVKDNVVETRNVNQSDFMDIDSEVDSSNTSSVVQHVVKKTVEKQVTKEFTASCVEFPRAMRKTLDHNSNTVFFAVKILYGFYNQHGRWPQPSSKEDMDNIIELKNKEIQHLTNNAPRRSVVKKITDSFVNMLVQHCGSEISPVCAILGGIVGQEIVKVICQNDDPYVNFFFFNGIDSEESGIVSNIFAPS
eukprot:TRINITY_DN5811_c0_g1_i1.p1 TRINITY_DN5811_c0_g1~~TRINITY_DN5811_c0_g1_i1.p1  ORF type:complete len:252 (+),score=35.15 TRINITY_DN5811_c0_g1_i1:418-1173(+)